MKKGRRSHHNVIIPESYSTNEDNDLGNVQCNPKHLQFQALANRTVAGKFTGTDISSDGGSPLPRKADGQLQRNSPPGGMLYGLKKLRTRKPSREVFARAENPRRPAGLRGCERPRRAPRRQHLRRDSRGTVGEILSRFPQGSAVAFLTSFATTCLFAPGRVRRTAILRGGGGGDFSHGGEEHRHPRNHLTHISARLFVEAEACLASPHPRPALRAANPKGGARDRVSFGIDFIVTAVPRFDHARLSVREVAFPDL